MCNIVLSYGVEKPGRKRAMKIEWNIRVVKFRENLNVNRVDSTFKTSEFKKKYVNMAAKY